jgi:hypothetical protein
MQQQHDCTVLQFCSMLQHAPPSRLLFEHNSLLFLEHRAVIVSCTVVFCGKTRAAHPVVDVVGDLGAAWDHVLGHVHGERGLGQDRDDLLQNKMTVMQTQQCNGCCQSRKLCGVFAAAMLSLLQYDRLSTRAFPDTMCSSLAELSQNAGYAAELVSLIVTCYITLTLGMMLGLPSNLTSGPSLGGVGMLKEMGGSGRISWGICYVTWAVTGVTSGGSRSVSGGVLCVYER